MWRVRTYHKFVPSLAIRHRSGANVPRKKTKNPLESRKKAVKEAQRILRMRVAQIEASKPRMEEIDPDLLRPERQRQRLAISEEEKECRVLLAKDWSRYQMQRYEEDFRKLTGLIVCRKKALVELKKASEILYEKAIVIDKKLFPLEKKGPTATPPLQSYEAPDAEEDYIHVRT
ncbi:large ribosomal subunit protein mL40-like [Corticium candelabrum]|uniref:large ribosomal subunit protein mL40-like n=1 Tax=Corticium candelabrum TaxID=121492 RepID=UPI002E25E983|nr:large ribosomal subunit protein mL40-like [Corticium candelabrum]